MQEHTTVKNTLREQEDKLIASGPSRSSVGILKALNSSAKHIYGGTVAPNEIARRRAKNKVARKSRRANR